MLDETEEEMESLRKQELAEKDEKENENLVCETLFKRDLIKLFVIIFYFSFLKLKVDWRNLMNLKFIPKDFYQPKFQQNQTQTTQQPQQQSIQV